MKKFLVALNVVIWSLVCFQVAHAEEAKPEQKKVCVKQKDAKTGKEKDVCKNVKIHKKHEGTKVEGTKPEGKK